MLHVQSVDVGTTSLDERRRRWSAQSAVLALMDDGALGAMVDRTVVDGWGASSTATLPDASPVFVKRLPLTEMEYARAHSTRNHFRLPPYYQYGVGSAGFGVWRELAVHVKTTGWVVDGQCAGFPMLLHHRVMRRSNTRRRSGPKSWVDSPGYVSYWNGSKRLAAFIDARRATPFELWLVLEHAPHRMFDWLVENQSAVEDVVGHQTATLRFLHDHGVFHFDAHFGNVVTDGAAPWLTDFGLANDRAFDLAPAERDFIDRHRHYDFGETLYSVGNALLGLLLRMPTEERDALALRLSPEVRRDPDALIELLVTNVEAVVADGALGVSPIYAAAAARYRPVILFMAEFFGAMRHNPRKNTYFDDAKLASLLTDAGVDVR